MSTQPPTHAPGHGPGDPGSLSRIEGGPAGGGCGGDDQCFFWMIDGPVRGFVGQPGGKDCLKEMPGGIGIGEGVIEHIGIAVQCLRIDQALHKGVGGEEAAEGGVVEAGIHVDQAEGVEHLVAGVAPGGGVGVGHSLVQGAGFKRRAEGAVVLPLDQDGFALGVVAGDGVGGAEVVVVQVEDAFAFDGAVGLVVAHGKDGGPGHGDRVVVFEGGARALDLLVAAAEGPGGCGDPGEIIGLGVADLLHAQALVGGTVVELQAAVVFTGRLGALGEGAGLVKVRPADQPPGARLGHVAVGVVAVGDAGGLGDGVGSAVIVVTVGVDRVAAVVVLLIGDIAECVVAQLAGLRDRTAVGGFLQPVEVVVEQRFVEVGDLVVAAQGHAEFIVLVAQVLESAEAAGAGADLIEIAGIGGIVTAGDGAVAEFEAGDAAEGVDIERAPVGVGDGRLAVFDPLGGAVEAVHGDLLGFDREREGVDFGLQGGGFLFPKVGVLCLGVGGVALGLRIGGGARGLLTQGEKQVAFVAVGVFVCRVAEGGDQQRPVGDGQGHENAVQGIDGLGIGLGALGIGEPLGGLGIEGVGLGLQGGGLLTEAAGLVELDGDGVLLGVDQIERRLDLVLDRLGELAKLGCCAGGGDHVARAFDPDQLAGAAVGVFIMQAGVFLFDRFDPAFVIAEGLAKDFIALHAAVAVAVGVGEHGGDAAEGVVVGLLAVFEIAAGDGEEFADAFAGRGVVGPAALVALEFGFTGRGFVAGGFAAQLVIVKIGALTLGVGLLDQLIEHIVLVGPLPHVRVLQGCFTALVVIENAGNMPACVGFTQIAAAVVFVNHRFTVGVGDLDRFAEDIVPASGALALGIGFEDAAVAGILALGHAVCRMGFFNDPIQQVIAEVGVISCIALEIGGGLFRHAGFTLVVRILINRFVGITKGYAAQLAPEQIGIHQGVFTGTGLDPFGQNRGWRLMAVNRAVGEAGVALVTGGACPAAVGAGFFGHPAEFVIGPGGVQAVGAGQGQYNAEPGVVAAGLAVTERVGHLGLKAVLMSGAVFILGRARVDGGAGDGFSGHIAVARVIGVLCVPHRVAGIMYRFPGQAAGLGVIQKTRFARDITAHKVTAGGAMGRGGLEQTPQMPFGGVVAERIEGGGNMPGDRVFPVGDDFPGIAVVVEI